MFTQIFLTCVKAYNEKISDRECECTCALQRKRKRNNEPNAGHCVIDWWIHLNHFCCAIAIKNIAKPTDSARLVRSIWNFGAGFCSILLVCMCVCLGLCVRVQCTGNCDANSFRWIVCLCVQDDHGNKENEQRRQTNMNRKINRCSPTFVQNAKTRPVAERERENTQHTLFSLALLFWSYRGHEARFFSSYLLVCLLLGHSFIHSFDLNPFHFNPIDREHLSAYVFVCTQFTISPIKLSTSERNRQCVRVMQCLHCVLNVLSIQNPIDSLINKWFYKTAHINSYDVRALFCPFLILCTVSLCERAYNLQPVPFQFCT